MKPKALKFFPLIFTAVLACCPTQTRATIALDFTGGFAGGSSDNVWGWDFSLSSNVFVTDLGLWDSFSGNGVGDGLVEAHTVTIWTSTGTLVTSAIVPAGSGGTLVDDFRYMSIAPTLLIAGNYVIGAHYLESGDPTDLVAFGTTTVTTAAEVTFGNQRSSTSGSGNVFPNVASSGNGFFGPNFQFVTSLPNGNGVPEGGGTLLLLGAAFGALGIGRFLRRRRCGA